MDKRQIDKILADKNLLDEWMRDRANLWYSAYTEDKGLGSCNIPKIVAAGAGNDYALFSFIPQTPGRGPQYSVPFDLFFDDEGLINHAKQFADKEKKKFEEESEERDLYEKLKYKFDGPKYLDDGWY